MYYRINKNKYVYYLLGFIVMCISVGYAILSSNLNISGTSRINNATWDIHFENLNVSTGSVEATTPASINSSTSVSYNVTLNKPGDFYEFTVDVKNDGSIDGMISSISSKMNGNSITSLPVVLDYKVTYVDGIEILNNQELKAGAKETYKVRLSYKTDINADDLPSSDLSNSFSFEVTYIQADADSINVLHPRDFSEDDLDTIISYVNNGTGSVYAVGSEKSIDMGTFGVQKIRVVNNSNPDECNDETFSLTACGFVLEFVNNITTHVMNDGFNNNGGWRDSTLRSYLNADVYNAFPASLRSSIIDTRVISSHGDNDSSNFVTSDKVYLFSPKEVGLSSSYDTAQSVTRVLDYYQINTDNSYRVKLFDGSNYRYWLRSTVSFSNFTKVQEYGSIGENSPYYQNGVAPAFRLGNS